MKLFTEKQVEVSALLGGPLTAGILIYKNYKALGKEKEAYISIVISLVFCVLLFYLLLQLPEEISERIPDFIVTAIYAILVFIFFRFFMSKSIEEAFENGAIKASNWSVAGFSLLGFIVTIGIILSLSFSQPFYEGKKIDYKGNELYYDEEINIDDMDLLVDELVAIDFFGEDYGNIARIQLIKDSYTVTLLIDESIWEDANTLEVLSNTKNTLNEKLEYPLILLLESVQLDGESKYKYI